jgi:hypothetical protein
MSLGHTVTVSHIGFAGQSHGRSIFDKSRGAIQCVKKGLSLSLSNFELGPVVSKAHVRKFCKEQKFTEHYCHGLFYIQIIGIEKDGPLPKEAQWK